ncbi:MAG: type II toxin-antitoxin system RelE/ParE family toxin [Patescibacteria group bacterium]
MVSFVFTKFAEKRFSRVSPEIQQRILSKLKKLKTHPDILAVLKPLHKFKPATHRLRIGDFRLILQLSINQAGEKELLVLDVGHRREVYH